MEEYIIKSLHFFLIVFVLLGVFLKDNNLKQLHSAVILSMLVHWIFNDDSCFLTVLEKQISGKTENNETFIFKLVSPVYKINDNSLGKLVHFITLILYTYSIYRLSIN